ncbi:hypothetical protein FCL47_23885 [Desulfopila sp. IMCC35006]|uniref:hypothetical protein n=1 Tax=Desulfopila sp. IMCC35006 TaxID=2569542 RepID=UPI0010AD3270|nr:hypothetical protein [Desulfopila sp. IMCC35006]TKB23115.1 hypothetical protein FCL47_23885 [Desulfopila sp. IMCC35006]
MHTDETEKLVDEAHAIFNATSIHEVIDLDKPAARAFLMKAYGNYDSALIDQYLEVIDKLR